MIKTCPLCGGPLEYLGCLGIYRHYRCRDCGMCFYESIQRQGRDEEDYE